MNIPVGNAHKWLWWCGFIPLWLLCVVLFSESSPIQFTVPALEYFRLLALGSLPLVFAVAIIKKMRDSWLQNLLLALSVPVVLVSLALTAFGAMWHSSMLNGHDYRNHIRTVAVGKHHVQVYRCNAQGALGGYDVELREEHAVLPLVKFVDTWVSLHDQGDTEINVVDEKSFTYVVDGTRSKIHPETRTYTFK